MNYWRISFPIYLVVSLFFILSCDKTKPSRGGPLKVVTLAPNLTEIVYALGMGPQLVGDTDLCDYPKEALKISKVGHYSDPSLEKILAYGANVVLATDGNPVSKLRKLESYGIRVVYVSPKNAQDLPAIIRTIAQNLQVEKAGNQLAAKIENALKELKANKEKMHTKQSFFLALQFDPIYSISDQTWLGDLFKMAGLVNIVGKSKIPYPIVSQEFLFKNKPDMFLVDTLTGKSKKESLELQKSKISKIYTKGHLRVVVLPKDILVRPGPRIIDGIKFLEKLQDTYE